MLTFNISLQKKKKVIIIFVISPDILILLFLKHSCREEDSESEKDKKVWYYSTKIQLAELIECLDKDYWEADLCKTLEEMREEVHRHMDVTEDLTNKARGTNKSFLSAANGKHILSSGNKYCTLNQILAYIYFIVKCSLSQTDNSSSFQCVIKFLYSKNQSISEFTGRKRFLHQHQNFYTEVRTF